MPHSGKEAAVLVIAAAWVGKQGITLCFTLDNAISDNAILEETVKDENISGFAAIYVEYI